MKYFPIAAVLLLLSTCDSNQEHAQTQVNMTVNKDHLHTTVSDPITPFEPVEKTEEEWREALSSSAFRILRRGGTEIPFTGKYNKTETAGMYVCAGCGHPLFRSETKYDSRSGWPSFWAPYAPNSVGFKEDRSYFMVRTEVHCKRCGGHLGHVFDDGPEPTGLRYCLNSPALELVPD